MEVARWSALCIGTGDDDDGANKAARGGQHGRWERHDYRAAYRGPGGAPATETIINRLGADEGSNGWEYYEQATEQQRRREGKREDNLDKREWDIN